MRPVVALLAAAVASPAAAQPPAARPAAFAICAACHAVAAGAPARLGPNLAGLGGRRAGGTDFAYSPAMKAAGIVWDRRTLAAFVTSPRAVVPGNRMAFAGQQNPAAVAAIVDYLIPPAK